MSAAAVAHICDARIQRPPAGGLNTRVAGSQAANGAASCRGQHFASRRAAEPRRRVASARPWNPPRSRAPLERASVPLANRLNGRASLLPWATPASCARPWILRILQDCNWQ
jgi:hypothetical protein